MTELDFYKFTERNGVECRKDENGMIIWVDFHLLNEFQSLIGYGIVAEKGLACTLKEDCVAFDVQLLSDYFGVDFASAFDK